MSVCLRLYLCLCLRLVCFVSKCLYSQAPVRERNRQQGFDARTHTAVGHKRNELTTQHLVDTTQRRRRTSVLHLDAVMTQPVVTKIK